MRFVVIGGAAIQSHGRRYVTEDIDLTPDTEALDRERLADALNEPDCRLVTDPARPDSWVAVRPGYFAPRSTPTPTPTPAPTPTPTPVSVGAVPSAGIAVSNRGQAMIALVCPATPPAVTPAAC